MNKNNWIKGVDYPEWGDNQEYFKMIGDYMQKGETPVMAYRRVATSIAKEQNMPDLADSYFDMIWNNWLCLASPTLANIGTERGFPISCFGINIYDDTSEIGMKHHEYMMMAKFGGGVGTNWNRVRHAGSPISDIGTSDGTRPFIKIFDTTTNVMKQGKVRSAAGSVNMNVRHGDFPNFLEMREATGDVSLQCQKLHHSATIDDEFMDKVNDYFENKNQKYSPEASTYLSILRKRMETGEPFILYKGNVNRTNPPMYETHGLEVDMTNICTEIMLHSDKDHSFVCCLGSLNLARFHEWKDTDTVKLATYFLDGVMSEFIRKAKKVFGFENAVRFAEKSRALGLGVLGWHSFLIQEKLPFTSLTATFWTTTIMKQIQTQAKEASKELAEIFGEPEWCKGFGTRNTHNCAVAPTTTNSLLSGGYSPGRDPYKAVYWSEWSAKGSIERKNKYFEALLIEKGKNTKDVWRSILANKGSVSHLDFLTDEEKELYLSAIEINQLELLRQASVAQKYVCQGISLNLFVPKNSTPSYIYKLHMEAYKFGIKSLYYMHSESGLSADMVKMVESDNCKSCES